MLFSYRLKCGRSVVVIAEQSDGISVVLALQREWRG